MLIRFCFYDKLNDFISICALISQEKSGEINFQEELNNNEKLLGLTNVSGQGITIDIQDGSDLIHQEDILILLNELKNAGAQAISVNDQRIIDSTYIYCDGSVILLDGVKIGNPFNIKAIGNGEVLYGALTRNKGYINILTDDGIKIDVKISDNVTINKTNKNILTNYKNTDNIAKKLLISNKILGKSDTMGSGLEIIIDTSETKDITAINLLQLINDLRVSKAEAISIDNQRIVNMTDIMDINKEYVLIDSICVSSPYVIKVIGDENELLNTINLENSTISKLIKNGKNISIRNKKNIYIPKYSVTKGQSKLLLSYMNNI